MPFFNYTIHAHDLSTAGYWQRREFLRAWWSLYRDDNHWTPPEYGRLRATLHPRQEHLARLSATLIHVDALQRTGLRRSRTDQQEIPLTSIVEYPLAAALLLIDPRYPAPTIPRGPTAHLALPHFANDAEAFDRLYHYLVESLSGASYRRVVGPVGLSPHLGSGLLVDGWNEPVPAHAPSNPPYAPELVERRWRPWQEGRLYRADVEAGPRPDEPPGPAVIRPSDPARLAGDLLPLLAAATENLAAAFPPPDAAEAAFLLRQLPDAAGLLAEVDGATAGFVLLGADRGAWQRATRGGRSLWRRGLWAAGSRVIPAGRLDAGRVYFGGVLPAQRGRGIGGQLWAQGLRLAAGRGWRTLIVGPVWQPPAGASPAVAFLAGRAAARQAYRLYEWSF